jgi:hypothetical protein
MNDEKEKTPPRKWVTVQFSKEELDQKTVEFKFPHRIVKGEDGIFSASFDGHGQFDVLGPNDQGLLSITLHCVAPGRNEGYILILTQQEADSIARNPPGARSDFSCFAAG